MTAAETYLVSNPGTMFLLMEEKVQALAREKKACGGRRQFFLWVCQTNAKLLNPWIGITSKGLWVLQKMMQALCTLQLLI